MRALRILGLLVALALWVAVGWLGSGCSSIDIPAGDISACERLKPAGAECATVYAFAEPADNALGHVELCVRAEDLEIAQLEHGIAWPSNDERFAKYAVIGIAPPCFWCCAADCGAGANAYGGSYCPQGVTL